MNTTYLSGTNNSIAEWLINYQGGFVRRGFMGEVFAQISLLTETPIRKVILYFLNTIFTIYFFLIFFFFKDIKKNYLIILSILSPLFLIFPIAEREALGRKDILIPLFLIFYCIIFNYFKFLSLSFFLIIIYIPLLLIHEVAIFYLPFFYLILLFKIEKINFYKILIIFLSSLLFLLIIYILSNTTHTNEEIKLMCDKMTNIFNEQCGMPAYVLNRNLSDNIAEIGNLSAIHILRNLSIFLFGNIALIFLIFISSLKHSKQNIINKYFNFKILSILIFLPTIIPFIIAVDWGRWFNLSYTMLIIFYFFCLKNNMIFINKDNKFFNYFNNFFKTKKNLLFLILILCFTWNPKAVYHEDIGSIPIYRIIIKIIN